MNAAQTPPKIHISVSLLALHDDANRFRARNDSVSAV